MPVGIALAIGLNSVDPAHYAGWTGDLNACEADAEDMAAIAQSSRFKTTTLLTKKGTRGAVTGGIQEASKLLKSGDIFMLTYSGHGGQLPDINKDEPDAQDETWCLYDGELVDDELHALFGGFTEGVRVLVFSDSCHSGTVTKGAYFRGTVDAPEARPAQAPKYRFMPPDAALRTYRKNKAFYDAILSSEKLRNAEAKIRASVLLVSGCQDNQLSLDGDFNGLFTSQLLTVWRNGAFQGTYRQFHRAIVNRMPPTQTPNYYGTGTPNPAFDAQRPFAI